MENPTNDLSQFGIRELNLAADLLKAYVKEQPEFLGEGVQVWSNMNSGYVFLSDNDYNVAMLNEDDKLEQFFSCPECGQEGFKEEFDKKSECAECRKIAKGEE